MFLTRFIEPESFGFVRRFGCNGQNHFKLEQVIVEHTRGHGLPVHSNEVVGDHNVDVRSLWISVKTTLQDLVVDKVEKNVVDAILKINRQSKETDLEFLTRIRTVYQTATVAGDEAECVSVYFGKLPSNLQDRILEWMNVED